MKWTKTGKFLLFFIMSLPLYAQLDVELSRSSISLGESSMLLIRVSGRDQADDPELPEVDGLSFQSRGTSRSTEIIRENNKTQRIDSTVYQWQVTPEKTGTFVIPPFQVVFDGKTYESRALSLLVEEPGTVQGYSLVIQSEMSEIIEWQPVSLNIIFYLSGKVGNLNFRIPFLEDDSFSVIPVEPLSSRQDIRQISLYGKDFYAYVSSEILKGVQYTTLTIPMYLIPEIKGAIELKPCLLTFDEEIGRDVLLRSQYKTRSIISNSLLLQVHSVPEELKNSENGILFSMGQLQGDWKISTQQLRMGDPLELEIQLKGLILPSEQMTHFPEPGVFMKSMEHFRFLSEKRKVSQNEEGSLLVKKNLRLISTDMDLIPSQELLYYNIETQKVERLILPDIPFELVGSTQIQQEDIETLGSEKEVIEDVQADDSPVISVAYSPQRILHQSGRILWKEPFHPLFFLSCLLPLLFLLLRIIILKIEKDLLQEKIYPWNESHVDSSILDSFKYWAQGKIDDREIECLYAGWEKRMYKDQEDTKLITSEMTAFAEEMEK